MSRSKSFSFKSNAEFALVCVVSVMLMFVTCGGGSNPQKALIGQWDLIESTIDRDLLADKMEILDDGTGLMEATNIRGIGAWAESFTWRIDSEGRLVITSPNGVAQIYSIVEMSKSALILEGDIPVVGNIRTTYSKRGHKATSEKSAKTSVDSGLGDATVAEPEKPAVAAESEKPANTFTDSRDGKQYRTVKIGNKTWMAENLNFKTGNSWCYDNNEGNCQKYGRIYDWSTAMKACPAGWRLPTREDWNNLVQVAGGNAAGKKLKSKTGWETNGNGTDDFVFSALPGGSFWDQEGEFSAIGTYGSWWSATEGEGHGVWTRSMSSDSDEASERESVLELWNSVRCVQK